jgi:competence protein ComEC
MQFRKCVHISWHIAWLCSGIIAGCAAAPAAPAVHGGVALLAAMPALLLLIAGKRFIGLIPAFVLTGLLLGIWRGGSIQQQYAAYEPLYGRVVQLRGTVTEDTTVSSKGDQRLTLRDITMAERSMPGRLWASTPKPHDIKRGDVVALEGRVAEGFGGVAASMHRTQVVAIERPYPGDVARRVRDWFAEKVRQTIQQPEADLGLGFLTGQHSTLPEDLDNQLRILGLTHIVVASGYNLTILVQAARRLLTGTSKYLAALASFVMIACFMAVTGLSPSMSRAGLVAGLSLLAWYYGRTMHPLVLLPFAAAVTLLVNPAYILGDIGWYLSFGSFVGVIVVSPLLQHYFWGKQEPSMLRQILVDTFSAQLVTLPVIMHTFSQYSPLALPANALILPFVPLAMLLTFVAGITQILLPVGTWTGLPAELVLRYMTGVVDWLGSLPFAQGEITFGVGQVAGGYCCLVALVMFLWKSTKHNFRQNN